MLIRTTAFRTLIALVALIVAAPVLASEAPASDLAARLDTSSPASCIDANDPALQTRLLAAAAADRRLKPRLPIQRHRSLHRLETRIDRGRRHLGAAPDLRAEG